MDCKTQYCLNDATPGRNYCRKCQSRMWRAANPIRATYINIKHRAKQRGKFFDLTLEQFTKFCTDNNYIELKGKSKDDMSIDCIKDYLGYTEGNLQMLTLSANAKKKRVLAPLQDDPNCPF